MEIHPGRTYCPAFGNYPKEYNRAVHGPYYPWVNYGPRDTPFQDVKLGEFKQWFARRNKTPAAAIAAISRTAYWWDFRWMQTRYGSGTKGFFQIVGMMSLASLLTSYSFYRNERVHKYHW